MEGTVSLKLKYTGMLVFGIMIGYLLADWMQPTPPDKEARTLQPNFAQRKNSAIG